MLPPFFFCFFLLFIIVAAAVLVVVVVVRLLLVLMPCAATTIQPTKDHVNIHHPQPTRLQFSVAKLPFGIALPQM